MALTEHIDCAEDKPLLRGKCGIVHSWLWPEGQARPSIVYVKFESAKWQPEGLAELGFYPIVPKTKSWYVDKGRKVKTLKVSCTQLPLTPAYSMTAHSSQGKTLRAVLLGLYVDKRVNPTIGTVATTRVRSREDVLIMRSFPNSSFNVVACSKSLSGVLRHNKRAYLFSERDRMNIANLFDQMSWQNPKEYNMSGAQFAALLLCNHKQRFLVDIHMQWEWYPYSAAATRTLESSC